MPLRLFNNPFQLGFGFFIIHVGRESKGRVYLYSLRWMYTKHRAYALESLMKHKKSVLKNLVDM